MKIIIGLGNPDKKYAMTRHNAGFMTVDFLVKKMEWSNFGYQAKFKAEVAEGKTNDEKIIIVKPQTYMNNSGEAARALQLFYKIKTEDIIAIYDELDLPFGEIRIRDKGSSAGHKGVESIMEKLGTDKFTRIRIGIRNEKADKSSADKFVLSRFTVLEKTEMKKDIWPRVLAEIKKLL